MSLKLGNTPIAGISTHTNVNAHSLFDCKWADHKLNEISWLEASTFSWQSGDVFVSAYNHLVQDIQGITAETETIGSYTITFYRATDGHKVALADQEQTVLNIYNETGVTWYYILDTTNTQFKLPRTKYGFEGLRTNVGDKIDESLPNITGKIGDVVSGSTSASGAFIKSQTINRGLVSDVRSVGYSPGSFDASRSSSTYQNNAPVQERATQMYLYFYVGDYTQTAIEQSAGLNAELFNNKLDLNASNLSSQGMSYMSSMGMPGDKYIDLTLGASGSTYTAPANGYYRCYIGGPSGDKWLRLSTSAGYIQEAGFTTSKNICFTVPIQKNEILNIKYSGTLTTSGLGFIYAEGEVI